MANLQLSAVLQQLRRAAAHKQEDELSDSQLVERFAKSRDESAFAALLRRHGPMVLGVCRGILRQLHDVEDAFQATFLILSQKAGCIRRGESVGAWLHGVAHNVALKARIRAARSAVGQAFQPDERTMPDKTQADPLDELTVRELRQALHEELRQLPEKYRAPLILCYLEGKTQEEAARQLGWPQRRVKGRLQRGGEQLRRRLKKRGLAPAVTLGTALFVAEDASSAVPAALAGATVRVVMTGSASSAVAALVKTGGAIVSFSKAKAAVAILLAVSVLSGAGAYFLASPQRQQGQSMPAPRVGEKAADAPRSVKRDETKTVEVHGRVLGPDGKPKAGAKLALLGQNGARELGVTAADGRFSVVIPQQAKHEWPPALLAHCRDAGLHFISLAGWDAAKPVELRLVKDQVIHGRVVNTEGKPIAGVRVSVRSIDVHPNNSLESLLVRWQKSPADFVLPPGEQTLLLGASWLLNAVTDAEGRFVISGVGADRVVELYLREGGIAKTTQRIVSHDGFDPKQLNPLPFGTYGSPPRMANAPIVREMLHGPNATLVVELEKPIRGVVKDADSGKGVPNVVVRLAQREDALNPYVTTKTDAQGRYEFRGAHKAKTYSLHLESDSSAGYLTTRINAADTVGYSPVNVDLRVKKGVIVTGKIIDKATGKAVPGFAQFTVLVNNPFVKDYPPFFTGNQRHNTAADGTFRVVTTPGPVLLMGGYYPPSSTYDHGPVMLIGGEYPPSSANFDYIELEKYRPPVADPAYPQYFGTLQISPRDATGYLGYGGGIGGIQGNYCKVLDIKQGTAVVHQDIFLERASILEVKLQDAEGRAIEGAWATDFATHTYIGPLWIDRSSCPVYGLEQRKPRLLTFYEPKKKIVGSQRLRGDEKGPVVVKLGPTGAIKGRLLDTDGKPMAGALLRVMYRETPAGQIHEHIHRTKQVLTDAAGAFTVDELIPKLVFELSVYRGNRRFEREAKAPESAIQVKPGECRDLGAMKLKPAPEKARE